MLFDGRQNGYASLLSVYMHMYLGGRQTVSLGSGCIQKGIVSLNISTHLIIVYLQIIHELMHAVGFFHEQVCMFGCC